MDVDLIIFEEMSIEYMEIFYCFVIVFVWSFEMHIKQEINS